jgi:hypothetical protein
MSDRGPLPALTASRARDAPPGAPAPRLSLPDALWYGRRGQAAHFVPNLATPTRKTTMLKILLLLAIVVVAVLVVRNALKAASDKRNGAEDSTRDAGAGTTPADANLVRCGACGAFVPKADAVVAGTGYRCGGAGCAPRP